MQPGTGWIRIGYRRRRISEDLATVENPVVDRGQFSPPLRSDGCRGRCHAAAHWSQPTG